MGPHGQDGWDRKADVEQRALCEIAGRLALDYPAATSEQVDAVLRSTFERASDARVEQYRLVLAERDARVRLRTATRVAPSAPGGRGDATPGRPLHREVAGRIAALREVAPAEMRATPSAWP
jgi:hypothetical protein